MSTIAERSGLSLQDDFRGFASQSAMQAYLESDSGLPAFAGIAFPDDGSLVQSVNRSLSDVPGEQSSVVPVEVWYNSTVLSNRFFTLGGNDNLGFSSSFDTSYVLQVQRAVNEALLVAHTGSADAKLEVSVSPFVYIPEDQEVSSELFTIESFGALFYILGVMISFIITLRSIVAEKDAKILDALRMMGLYESCYWLSWVINYAVISFASSLLMVVAGVATAVPLFARTNFVVIWLVLYVYLFSMSCLAMALSAIIPSSRVATLVGFLFLSVAVIFQLFVSLRVFDVITLMYNPYSLSTIALNAINLYPPLLFAKIDSNMYGYVQDRTIQINGAETNVFREYDFAAFSDGSYQYISPFQDVGRGRRP